MVSLSRSNCNSSVAPSLSASCFSRAYVSRYSLLKHVHVSDNFKKALAGMTIQWRHVKKSEMPSCLLSAAIEPIIVPQAAPKIPKDW